MSDKFSPSSVFVRFLLFVLLFLTVSALFFVISNHVTLSDNDSETASTLDNGNEDIYIIIDAGHGGEDGGAVSFDGLLEKDVNLDIAKKLHDFMLLSDFTPIMTRFGDNLLYSSGQENRKKFYDITNRINIANQYENAVFVSIHQNKFPIRKYNGFQVYCSKNNKNSAVLGTVMQDNIRTLLQKDNKREIKIADNKIRVLDSLKIPAVLAECGFLSNEDEAKLLSTEEYRNKISYILYASVMQYIYENGV